MVCLYEQGGFEPVRTFFGQVGGGQFFAILCGRLKSILKTECTAVQCRLWWSSVSS